MLNLRPILHTLAKQELNRLNITGRIIDAQLKIVYDVIFLVICVNTTKQIEESPDIYKIEQIYKEPLYNIYLRIKYKY